MGRQASVAPQPSRGVILMPEEPRLPQLSAEEQLEQEILAQTDAREIVLREAAGVGSIVWRARESQALGRRVTTVFRYYDLYDGDARIGRQCDGWEKHITDAGVSVAVGEPVIVGSRQRGE